MERRKLAVERILDNEILYAKDDTAQKLFEEVENGQYQRFVFNAEDVGMVPSDTAEAARALSSPPFGEVWVEVNNEGRCEYMGLHRAATSTTFVFAMLPQNSAVYVCRMSKLDVELDEARVQLSPSFTNIVRASGMSDAEASKFAMHAYSRLVKALMLLHTQGDVVRERLEAPAEVNAKRVKRGKPQLQPYTYVYLNRETDYSSSVESTGRVVSQHIRRGHFKRTRHGTFWWRPCVVGSGPAKERKAYIVKR